MPLPEKIWQDPWYFIASGFGAGSLGFMPGTYATLAAIPFYLLLTKLSWFSYVLVLVILTALSAWLSGKVSSEIGEHDHPGLSLDEYIGFFVTMIAVSPTWLNILLGFALFRVFDIFKPGPIRWIDKHVHGGWGMMLDDIVAGLCSCVILHLLNSVL